MPRVWVWVPVGRPKCKAPAGFPSFAEPVRAYGAGYAIGSRPGLHNGEI